MSLSSPSRYVLSLVLLAVTPAMLDAQTSRASTPPDPPVLGIPSADGAATGDPRLDAADLGPPLQAEGAMVASPDASVPTPRASAAGGDTAAADDDRILGVPAESTEAEPAEAIVWRMTRADRAKAISKMFGYSGRLRATVVAPGEAEEIAALGPGGSAAWVSLFQHEDPGLLGEPARIDGYRSPNGAGIYLLEDREHGFSAETAVPLAVITTAAFDLKRGGYLNGYHIGRYPVEGSGRNDRYAPPAGFIEVTPENQDFQISEHFRLRQFLTKDQGDVWPKYLALDLRLIDKLELVLQELNAMGIRADAMHVMSGFRTPQYNGPGGDGRAALSRHTYGDAADVWVDSDGDGYMDDLNGDGRADIQDARVMLRAVERVESRYPDLVGGAGTYVANSAHGPFIHIDVRGTPARW